MSPRQQRRGRAPIATRDMATEESRMVQIRMPANGSHNIVAMKYVNDYPAEVRERIILIHLTRILYSNVHYNISGARRN